MYRCVYVVTCVGIFKPGACRLQDGVPGFLKSLLCRRRCVYVFVLVSVCPPQGNKKPCGMVWTLYDWLNYS